ncbi:DUF1998 domain-containing protein [Pseudomonas sp. R32]|uniref:DUF1998 domain-containing protein n=1 Tax=Pseudomonas sp. R32 TaxID=1573704 RepID=UPI00132E9DD4|nr:DUF1998 domain-containing protein [Pseudomonas sp. R32]QHF29308.1 hypothetical protein PspR32_16460 [Pseudomonas sp. R32]
MAIFKRTEKQSSNSTSVSPGNPGVEPVGRIRRSQLISTYGVGAIVDLEKGSYMPMGLEDWDRATSAPALSISEDRLQILLGVDHFRLAPIAEDLLPTRQVDPKHAVPVIRFPKWHQCPKCLRIGKEGQPFELAANGSELECRGHPKPLLTTPVRFVVACAKGHIDDFPWEWWSHRRRESACDRPTLELKSDGKSAALADIYVQCKNCGARESLGDAFRPEAMKGQSCRGSRPWLHDRQDDCDAPPRVIQRGASNVHFPVVASALSIPPASEAAFQIIDDQWLALGALPEEAVIPALAGIAKSLGVDLSILLIAYRAKQKLLEGASERTEISSRREEYEALSSDCNHGAFAGIMPQFCNQVKDAPDSLSKWFDIVGAVSRLREVRALAGFTRIEPYPVSPENIRDALNRGVISPLSKTPKKWLPATEIRGEGIFLRFRTAAIDEWINDNRNVQDRIKTLEHRSATIASERNYERDYTITARLLLIHSFAHAMIRTISIDCGYSSSSLRERLYVSEADGALGPMNGVLIYTGSPDSEGSLGGLVRLADPTQLTRVIMKSIRSALWCGSDPVCSETEPEQSGDKVSGAACHCCLLVPETACEKFNRELDRTMLVGSAHPKENGGWLGFFSDKNVE